MRIYMRMYIKDYFINTLLICGLFATFSMPNSSDKNQSTVARHFFAELRSRPPTPTRRTKPTLRYLLAYVHIYYLCK